MNSGYAEFEWAVCLFPLCTNYCLLVCLSVDSFQMLSSFFFLSISNESVYFSLKGSYSLLEFAPEGLWALVWVLQWRLVQISIDIW